MLRPSTLSLAAVVFIGIDWIIIPLILALILAIILAPAWYEKDHIDVYADFIVVEKPFRQTKIVEFSNICEYTYLKIRSFSIYGAIYELGLYNETEQMCAFSPQIYNDTFISANLVFRLINDRWAIPGNTQDDHALDQINKDAARTYLENNCIDGASMFAGVRATGYTSY